MSEDDVRDEGRLYTVDEVGSHLDRNQWQAPLAPQQVPPTDVWRDPVTGVEWDRDGMIERHFAAPYHSVDTDGDGRDDLALDCFRGTLPDETVEALRDNPDYREAFANVAGPDSPWNVDEITPGAQVCYDPRDGSLTKSGTWDYATPQPFQYDAHKDLDVDRHEHFNTYEDQFGNDAPPYDPGPSYVEPTYDAPSSDYVGSGSDGGGSASGPSD